MKPQDSMQLPVGKSKCEIRWSRQLAHPAFRSPLLPAKVTQGEEKENILNAFFTPIRIASRPLFPIT
jgi:hypothetical protein